MAEKQAFASSNFLILVVDDAATNLKILWAVLEPAGYTLTFASGGKQALERVRTAKPDLILLDLMMPDLDGLQVCQTLKQDPEQADIPIIFLTASHETNHLLQAFNQGAVDYLTKPFKKAELLARVKTHLELKHLRDLAQQQIDQERILSQIIQGIRYSLDLDTILHKAVSEIRHFLNADRVIICSCTLPQQCKIVASSSASTVHPILDHQLIPINWLDFDQSADEPPQIQQISYSETANLSQQHHDFLSTWQIKTELSLPIFQREQLWGALMCHRSQPWTTDEVSILPRLVEQIAIAIQQAELYQQLQTANQELQRLSNVDGLTQVANRRYFDQCFGQEWRRLQRERQPLSLILCDVDYFKQYNDYYGHQQGDACLQLIAATLAKTLKRPSDLVARYGGEEFAIVLPNTDLAGAIQIVKLIQQSLVDQSIPHAGAGHNKTVTLSLGIADCIPAPQMNANQLIAAADQALYSAKASGRDRCEVTSLKQYLLTHA